VARLGGDEFGLLLVGASAQSARRKCQTLARALAEMPLSVDGSPTPLAASFGVAVYDGTEVEEMLLHRADMAMYAAKRRRSQSALPDARDAASLTPAWPGCPAARPSECEVP
jgi:diguanylate cyclase (GGDEF)-like protein